jgi:hypothetical protein
MPMWLSDLLVPRIEPSPVGQARPGIEESEGWGPRPWYSRAALQRACEAIERAPVEQQEQTLSREWATHREWATAREAPRLQAGSAVEPSLPPRR